MNNRNRLQKVYRKRIIKAFGGFCWFCFRSDVTLEFHHLEETELRGRGRGRKERYYDILNNPNSFALACNDCHKETHKKEINLKLLLISKVYK